MKKVVLLIVMAIFAPILLACSEPNTPHVEVVTPFSTYDSVIEIPVVESTSQEAVAESTVESSAGQFTTDNSVNNVPIQSQQNFLVSQKKVSYQGNDVMILHVKNQTDNNYSISIIAKYKDSTETVIKSETKSFEGFAAGYENFFVFQPNINFDTFSFELKTEEFIGIPVAKYLVTTGTNGDKVRLELARSKMNLETMVEFDDWYTVTSAFFNVANTYDKKLYYSADFVLLDNTGEIYIIDSRLVEKDLRPISKPDDIKLFGHTIYLSYTDVLWKDKDSYVWPENLTGDVVGFVAMKEVKE